MPEDPDDHPIAFNILRVRRALERLGFDVSLRNPEELLALWKRMEESEIEDGEGDNLEP